jgi:hypothetical protein
MEKLMYTKSYSSRLWWKTCVAAAFMAGVCATVQAQNKVWTWTRDGATSGGGWTGDKFWFDETGSLSTTYPNGDDVTAVIKPRSDTYSSDVGVTIAANTTVTVNTVQIGDPTYGRRSQFGLNASGTLIFAGNNATLEYDGITGIDNTNRIAGNNTGVIRLQSDLLINTIAGSYRMNQFTLQSDQARKLTFDGAGTIDFGSQTGINSTTVSEITKKGSGWLIYSSGTLATTLTIEEGVVAASSNVIGSDAVINLGSVTGKTVGFYGYATNNNIKGLINVATGVNATIGSFADAPVPAASVVNGGTGNGYMTANAFAGAITYSGTIQLNNNDLVITSASGTTNGTVAITGSITGTGNVIVRAGGDNQNGASVTFGINNGHNNVLGNNGNLDIQSGMVKASGSGVVNVINTTGTLNIAAGAVLDAGTDRTITVGGLTGGGLITNDSSGNTKQTLAINNVSGTSVFSGTVLNHGYDGGTRAAVAYNLAVIKTGEGTQIFDGQWSGTSTGNNAGLIQVNQGTLLINGDFSGATTAAVTVAAGATFGGNGVIGSVTTLNTLNTVDATLLVLADPNKSLTFNNTLTVGNAADIRIQVLGDDLFGKLTLNGTYNLGDSLIFDLTGGSWSAGVHNYNLEEFFSDTYTGLDNLNVSVDPSWESIADLLDVNYADGILTINAIPEPSTWILLGLGAGLLAVLRRNKRL